MPLPTDQSIVSLSERLIAQFDTIFGVHPGFRPAHARGLLLKGTFIPTNDASTLSSAPHFHQSSTPITVRFSNSTGIPLLPDTDPNANPRGFAVRFNLGPRIHTDIVAHSTPAFPTRTGDEFLEFLNALASSAQSTASPTPIEAFLASHPAALAFVKTPKPSPSSFAREAYFGLTAFKFINSEGTARFGRFLILPDAGVDHLDNDALKGKSDSFLFDELTQRVNSGPITFQLYAQIANDQDVVDDVTVHWPEDRPRVHIGTLTLTEIIADNNKEQQHIIFDPIPRVQGIEASDDPLLEVRAATYLISGRRRRLAKLDA
jgi:catalase